MNNSYKIQTTNNYIKTKIYELNSYRRRKTNEEKNYIFSNYFGITYIFINI